MMTHAVDATRPPARAGVSQSTTAAWTLAEDVRAYGDAGWSAVGVWLNKLERPTMTEFWFPESRVGPETVEAAATTIRAAGLAVSHVLLGGRFTEVDEELRARRIEYTLFAANTARQLGAACLVVVPGRLNGLRTARATSLAASALAEVLERSVDVRLAIEPVKEVDFVTTLDEAINLVELVDHPRLGVYPDAFHLWRDAGLAESIPRAGRRILGVHLADSSGVEGDRRRLPPGEGVIPLTEFVAAVEAAGYEGTYDVELFSMDSMADDAGALLHRCAAGLHALLPAQTVTT